MNTVLSASAPSLAELQVLPQIESDVSSRLPGWFFTPAGIDPGELHVTWLSSRTPASFAADRLSTPRSQPPAETSPREASASANGRSELGRRLREIRGRIVASGEHLLSWDEIDSELAARRGEAE